MMFDCWKCDQVPLKKKSVALGFSNVKHYFFLLLFFRFLPFIIIAISIEVKNLPINHTLCQSGSQDTKLK